MCAFADIEGLCAYADNATKITPRTLPFSHVTLLTLFCDTFVQFKAAELYVRGLQNARLRLRNDWRAFENLPGYLV